LYSKATPARHLPFARATRRVDDARADGRQLYDGDEDLTDWTDEQIRELACDMLGIDQRYARFHLPRRCPRCTFAL
jgi:hypothetical protein